MEPRTVEDLLSDLTDQINFANPEKFRGRVLDYMRHVLSTIGFQLAGVPFSVPMDIVEHELKIPNYAVLIEDYSLDGYLWAGYQTNQEIRTSATLYAIKSGYGIRFPNISRGSIYVKGRGLRKDDQDNTLIPIECYMAIERYCFGKLLEGQCQHPLFQNCYKIQQEAELLMGKARADLIPETTASNRTQRHATGQLKNFDNSYYNW